ncbi:unnamed protein product [Cunninghamella blakesleeana]
MTCKLLFYYKIVFTILLFNFGVQSQSFSLIRPGCTLIKTSIYCFGGYTLDNNLRQSPSNTNIFLDLSKYNNFTNFKSEDVQWNVIGNTLSDTGATLQARSFSASTSTFSDDTILIYGGISSTENPTSSPIANPFIGFQTQLNKWRNLLLPSSGNFTSRSTMVNLGNDTIWIWGGQAQSSSNYSPNIVYLYNYRNSQWLNQINSDWGMRIEHTATLANNNMIYIIGGSVKVNDASFEYASLNNIIQFDTQTSTWSNVTATGDFPKNRVSHTTTQIPGKNQLLIYGGVDAFREPDYLPDSLCYAYDYEKNTYTLVAVPRNPKNGVNTLYGHFATSYAGSFIIFAFGYVNISSPSVSLNVLNITDLNNLNWVIEPVQQLNNTPTSETPSQVNKALSSGTIVAIVVPIVVIVLGCVICVFAFLRYKSRKQQSKLPADPFQMDDPREKTGKHGEMNLLNEESHQQDDDDFCKPTELEFTKPSELSFIKPSESNHIKPSEVEFTKPSEGFYKLTEYTHSNDKQTTITTSTAVNSSSSEKNY